jgi:hypothetical protein
VHAAVIDMVCEKATVLQLLVVTSFKISIHPVANPTSVYSH